MTLEEAVSLLTQAKDYITDEQNRFGDGIRHRIEDALYDHRQARKSITWRPQEQEVFHKGILCRVKQVEEDLWEWEMKDAKNLRFGGGHCSTEADAKDAVLFLIQRLPHDKETPSKETARKEQISFQEYALEQAIATAKGM